MVAATTSDSALRTKDSAPSSSSALSPQSSALPLLLPPDEALLTRLFETEAPSLPDLFKSLTQNRIDGAPQSLLDLYRWSQRPDIRLWLDFHDSELAAAIRRRRIAKLEQIADTSKDLVEQRRACTTVLRALDNPRKYGRPSGPTSLTTRAGASPAPQPFAPPSEPRPPGSGNFQPPAAPHPAETVPSAAASSPVHLFPSSPAHSPVAATSPHPPISQSPHPLPPSSPDSLLELVIAHTQTPRDPASIAALAGALAPNATINHTAADPLAPQAALATLPPTSSNIIDIDPPAIESTDDTISWSTVFTYAAGNRTRFRLVLDRIDDQWLISSLDHHNLNSS